METNPIDPMVTYQIVVQGQVTLNWSDRLEDMTITVSDEGGEPATTTLQGMVDDPGALAGVINSLYEMNMQVISVKWLDIWNLAGDDVELKAQPSMF